MAILATDSVAATITLVYEAHHSYRLQMVFSIHLLMFTNTQLVLGKKQLLVEETTGNSSSDNTLSLN